MKWIKRIIKLIIIILFIICIWNSCDNSNHNTTLSNNYSSSSSNHTDSSGLDKADGVSWSAYNSGKYYYATHEPKSSKSKTPESKKNLKGNAHGYAFWDEISE